MKLQYLREGRKVLRIYSGEVSAQFDLPLKNSSKSFLVKEQLHNSIALTNLEFTIKFKLAFCEKYLLLSLYIIT